MPEEERKEEVQDGIRPSLSRGWREAETFADPNERGGSTGQGGSSPEPLGVGWRCLGAQFLHKVK